MVKRTRIWMGLAIVPLIATVAACGSDGGGDGRAQKPVEGTFVGKVAGTNAFLAVVALPAAKGEDKRDVNVYVTDGEGMSEWLAGSVESNSFTAKAEDTSAKGKLTAGSASGTLELPGGKTVRYEAAQATATSGLYDLTVSRRGKLTGASAAGVGLSSQAGLEAPGTGTLRFADGKRRKFDITVDTESDPTRLRAGQIRLIVLPDGDMTGAGQNGSSAPAGDPDFYIRSAG